MHTFLVLVEGKSRSEFSKALFNHKIMHPFDNLIHPLDSCLQQGKYSTTCLWLMSLLKKTTTRRTKTDMTVSSILIAWNVDFDSFVTFNRVSRHFQDLMHPWGMNRMQERMKRQLYPSSCLPNVQQHFLPSNDSKKCLMLVDLNKGVDTGWMKKEE